MRSSFMDYLVEEGVVPAERLAHLQRNWRDAADTIGAIAFRHRVLSGEDIDDILDEQVRQYRPFGQIACELGRLDEQQVRMLLRMQQLRMAVDLVEELVLSGIVTADQILPHFGRFMQRNADSVPVPDSEGAVAARSH